MSGFQNNGSLIFLALCGGLSCFLIICSVGIWISKDKIAVHKRMKKLGHGEVKEYAPSRTREKQKQKGKGGRLTIKITEIITNELITANVLMRPEEFLILWIVLIFVPGGLAALLNHNPIPAFTLIGLGAVLPPVYIQRQKRKRMISFENQLGDVLAIISNCLRSGLTFQQAMENIAKEMPDPIAREFGRAVREIKYGNTVEKALHNMTVRIKSADLLLTVSAVLIQRQVGGNLSEVLDNISETIKERLKIKDEIRVLTATGRISGTVIGMLPVGIGVILLLLNPDYITLFFETTMGKMLLVLAGVLELIGFLFVKKIVTVKY